MDINEYLVENEKVVTETSVFNGREAIAENKKGNIACTTNRLIFAGGNEVIDISLSEVNSVQYKLPSYPDNFASAGVAGLVIGASSYFLHQLLNIEIAEIIAMISVSIGLIILLLGLLFRRRVLHIHTPNISYTFSGKDESLEQIIHAVRAYEQNH